MVLVSKVALGFSLHCQGEDGRRGAVLLSRAGGWGSVGISQNYSKGAGMVASYRVLQFPRGGLTEQGWHGIIPRKRRHQHSEWGCYAY